MDQNFSQLGSVEHPLMVCRGCLGMQPLVPFGWSWSGCVNAQSLPNAAPLLSGLLGMLPQQYSLLEIQQEGGGGPQEKC